MIDSILPKNKPKDEGDQIPDPYDWEDITSVDTEIEETVKDWWGEDE